MIKLIQVRQSGDITGYLEHFSIGKPTKQGTKVSLVFGIDAMGKPTRPAVFTQEGIKPLNKVVKENSYAGMTDFLKSHRGVYSVAKVTMGMCTIQGKVLNGTWTSDTSINIFIPYRLSNTGTMELIQLSEGNGVGVVHFDNLGKLKQYVLQMILPYIRDRETFLLERIK